MPTITTMNKLLLLSTSLCFSISVFSQGVGVNNTGANPNPNAILDADASTNDKGILIPRITSGQRAGIGGLGATEEGLTVYDETTNSYWLWDGAQWVQFMMMNANSADNGLYVNTVAQKVRMGGPLVEATTISQANFTLIHDLTGTGDFAIEDAGTRTFEVRDDGTTRIGDDMYWLDANTAGTILAALEDDADDGRFRMYENGIVSMDLDMNSQFIFNEQGLDRNFRVESDGIANMFTVDAGTNRVGIGTGAPVDRLEVAGGRVEFTATTDASGVAGSGVLEIANALRIDGNEVITNTNTPLYLQNGNNGDLIVDATTFIVDASTNRVGISTTAPSTTLDVNGTVRIRGGGPTAGDFLMSQDANGNAIWAREGYGLVPIGSIIGWHGNLAGIPALPAGWVECIGGTVSDGASPINGRPIPNLNGNTTSTSGDASRGRFLRGSTTSGLFQNDETNNFEQYHQDDDDGGVHNVTETIDDDGNFTQYLSDYNSDDRMRFRVAGVENRVTNMSVRWIMRIK